MLIVWGKRRTHQPRGYAAGFCMSCKSARMFKIRAAGEYSHLYYIKVGSFKPLYADARCETCGAIFAGPLDDYPHTVNEPELTQSAIEATAPDLHDYIERVEQMENSAMGAEFPPEQRRALLAENIVSFDYMSQIKTSTGASESITSVITLFFIIAGVGSVMCPWGGMNCPFTWIWYLSTAVLLATVLYRIWRSSAHNRAAPVLEHVARSIMVLDPTREELEQIKQDFADYPIIRSMKIDKLHALTESLLESESLNSVS